MSNDKVSKNDKKSQVSESLKSMKINNQIIEKASQQIEQARKN